MGLIKAVCISEKKGTVKKDIGKCRLIEDYGLEKDAHAGSGRQVSLLSYESVEAFKKRAGKEIDLKPGIFGENLLVSGINLSKLPVGSRLICKEIELEITQIGKQCHTGCEIMKLTGECIMPKEGVFAKIIRGGEISVGDKIDVEKRQFTAAVITVSDRSYRNEREDKSGPVLCEELKKAGYDIKETLLLPDEEQMIKDELIRLSDKVGVDVIFTTGGTGFAARDVTPEATMAVADKLIPGIPEAMRTFSRPS